jgi:hypothetical protein
MSENPRDEYSRIHEELERAHEEIARAGEEIRGSVRGALENIDLGDMLQGIGEQIRVELGAGFDPERGSEREAEDREFAVGPRPELFVKTVSGRITIETGDPGTIRVHVEKRGSRRRIDNTHIEYQAEGNRVIVRTRGVNVGMLGVQGGIASTTLHITVPPDCTVQCETVSADVNVRGIQAAVQVQGVSGDLRLHGIAGNTTLTTVSGDIHADDIQGELVLRTTSGDAHVMESRIAAFNLNTVSGDLTIDTPLTEGEHYLAKTISGDLRLYVPDGTSATVQLKTVSGDARVNLPDVEVIKSGRRTWQGRIGAGSANLEMTSVSGDLRIQNRKDRSNGKHAGHPWPATPPVPPVPPTPPTPPSPPTAGSRPSPAPSAPEAANDGEHDAAAAQSASVGPGAAAESATSTTTEVLRLLAQGEISVEEAMSRLDSLSG